uniref:Uncharacterized protein n=1 Tax=Oryza barthii TaxID=65489 RepID=A0A0D3HPD6_9ORYZ
MAYPTVWLDTPFLPEMSASNELTETPKTKEPSTATPVLAMTMASDPSPPARGRRDSLAPLDTPMAMALAAN